MTENGNLSGWKQLIMSPTDSTVTENFPKTPDGLKSYSSFAEEPCINPALLQMLPLQIPARESMVQASPSVDPRQLVLQVGDRRLRHKGGRQEIRLEKGKGNYVEDPRVNDDCRASFDRMLGLVDCSDQERPDDLSISVATEDPQAGPSSLKRPREEDDGSEPLKKRVRTETTVHNAVGSSQRSKKHANSISKKVKGLESKGFETQVQELQGLTIIWARRKGDDNSVKDHIGTPGQRRSMKDRRSAKGGFLLGCLKCKESDQKLYKNIHMQDNWATFTRKKNLENHLDYHADRRIFECEHCRKKFGTDSTQGRHTRCCSENPNKIEKKKGKKKGSSKE